MVKNTKSYIKNKKRKAKTRKHKKGGADQEGWQYVSPRRDQGTRTRGRPSRGQGARTRGRPSRGRSRGNSRGQVTRRPIRDTASQLTPPHSIDTKQNVSSEQTTGGLLTPPPSIETTQTVSSEQTRPQKSVWNQSPEEARKKQEIARRMHLAQLASQEKERQLAEKLQQEEKTAKAKSEGRIAPDDREVTHFSKWINPNAQLGSQINAKGIINEKLGKHALFHNNLGTAQQNLFNPYLNYRRGNVDLRSKPPIEVLEGSYPEFEITRVIENDGAIYFKSNKEGNRTFILTFLSPRVYRGLNIKDFNSDGSLKHNGNILPRCIDTRLNPNEDVTCFNPRIREMINSSTVEELNRHTFPGCCSNSIVDWVTTGSKKHVDLTVSKFISFSTEVVTPLFYCYTHTGEAGENGGPPGLAGHSGVMISFNPEGLTQFLPPINLNETYFPSTLHFMHTEGDPIKSKDTNDLIVRTYQLLASDREVLLSNVPGTKLQENEGGKAYRVSGKYLANKRSIRVYVDQILEGDLQNSVNITDDIKSKLKTFQDGISFKSSNDNVMVVATKICNKVSSVQRTEGISNVERYHFMVFICVAVPVSQLQSVLTTHDALRNLSSNSSDERNMGKIMLYEFGPPREDGQKILEIVKVKDRYKIQPIQDDETGSGGGWALEDDQQQQ